PLAQVASDIAARTGRTIVALAGDMSKAEDVDRCVKETLGRFGHIDILVTCAGSSPGGLLEELTEEHWLSSLNLKFMGYVRSVRAVIPHMRERGEGAIVLVVGNDGLKPSYWEMTAGVANAADINFASSVAEGLLHQRRAHSNRRRPAQGPDGRLMGNVTEVRIPAAEGRAFRVPNGALLEIVDVEGQQVADFISIIENDPKEWLSATHT